MIFQEYNGVLLKRVEKPPKKMSYFVGKYLISTKNIMIGDIQILPNTAFLVESLNSSIKTLVEVPCQCCRKGIVIKIGNSKDWILSNFVLAEKVKMK